MDKKPEETFLPKNTGKRSKKDCVENLLELVQKDDNIKEEQRIDTSKKTYKKSLKLY